MHVDSRGGQLHVKHLLDSFSVPAPGLIHIRARVETDTTYGARAEQLRLLVHDNVTSPSGGLMGALLLLLGGGVLLILGVIIVAVTRTGAQPGDMEQPTPDDDARLWAALAHVAALAAYVGVPFGHILGPLIVWLIKKDRHAFISEHGKEALNFNITITLYTLIAFLLCFVVVGFVLLPLLLLLHVILTIIASVRASDGLPYRYPLTLRLIK
jgi:uncharacterized Tic20 family protein